MFVQERLGRVGRYVRTRHFAFSFFVHLITIVY